MSAEAKSSGGKERADWKRLVAILAGIGLFAVVYLSPPWPDAVDPSDPLGAGQPATVPSPLPIVAAAEDASSATDLEVILMAAPNDAVPPAPWSPPLTDSSLDAALAPNLLDVLDLPALDVRLQDLAR